MAKVLTRVDGWPIHVANMEDCVNSILKLLHDQHSFMICTLNLDHIAKLRRNSGMREAYRRAELVTADGFPIVWLAYLNGVKLNRTAGADLVHPLCAAASSNKIPIFLFGSTFRSLRLCATRLKRQFKQLEIAGAYSPSKNFSIGSRECDDAILTIKRSGAKLCFVALGAPLQELFSAWAMERSTGIAFLPIGGALDFLAGTQLRAPKIFQDLNLEWAWRLALNPRRFGLRYFRSMITFFALLFESRLGERAGG
jgi:N-acetylglucosaminyldiphosphoundecaprenol N-acetyl-beta-D-mannosaminyltransferase